MQGLGAEHQVDIWRALDDRRTFLAGDTAADTDQQIRIALLQVLDATKI